MTTLTSPNIDLEQIAHLDHTPTCGVNVPTGPTEHDRAKCGAEATWWIQNRHHCVHGRTLEGFLCQAHYDRMSSGDVFACTACRQAYQPWPLVTRTERIR